jgi:hypothetical protein
LQLKYSTNSRYGLGVEKVGTVTHVMQPAHLSKFESKRKNGKLMYYLHYNREVLLGSKEGTLQFRVTCDGEELGTATFEYAKD